MSSYLAAFKGTIARSLIRAKRQLPADFYRSPPNWFGYVLVLPGILLASFLFVGLLLLTQYSFFTFDPFEIYLREYTLDNWRTLLSNESYYRVFGRTFGLAALITVLSVTLAIPYAYVVTRARSALVRKLLLIAVFVPFFTGVIIRTYGWLIVLGRSGLVNSFFGVFGLGPYQLIGNEFAVVLGLLQVMIPFSVIMIVPAIQGIDRNLERSAASLGAPPLERFRHVVFPLALPGIGAATIVVFTITSARYAIPELLGRGRVDFVANVIHTTLFAQNNYPLASTFAVALVLISSVVVFVIFSRIGIGTLGIGEGTDDE